MCIAVIGTCSLLTEIFPTRKLGLSWGAKWRSDPAMEKIGGLSPLLSGKMLTEDAQINGIVFAS